MVLDQINSFLNATLSNCIFERSKLIDDFIESFKNEMTKLQIFLIIGYKYGQ